MVIDSCLLVDFINYFTQAMDLRPNSDEGKVEALAAFGKADKDLLKHLTKGNSYRQQ